MVVVDSSALLPLAWVGRLELVTESFADIHTIDVVREEVLIEGKRGTASLERFLDSVEVHPTPSAAEEVAQLEGVATTDAGVILLAADTDQRLLANDKGLIQVAKTHDVDCWWVTTLLLHCRKTGGLSQEEATTILYELVNEGMNLHPKVYTKVQKKLKDIGE